MPQRGMEKQYNDLAEEYVRLQEKYRQLEKRYADTSAAYEQIRQSAVWKATGPLRGIASGVKKGLKGHEGVYLAARLGKVLLTRGPKEAKLRRDAYRREKEYRWLAEPEERESLPAGFERDERYLLLRIGDAAGAGDPRARQAGEVSWDLLAQEDAAWLVWADAGTEFQPETPGILCGWMNREGWDAAYSDGETMAADRIHRQGRYLPDWSPDLLRAEMYMGGLVACRKSAAAEAGMNAVPGSWQEVHELILRMSEKTDQIGHVPEKLYSRRETEAAGCLPAEAVTAHLRRVYGAGARAEKTDGVRGLTARYPMPADTMVSVIIPMKDHREMTEACVRSILEKSSWQNYEILILNNRSREPETLAWLAEVPRLDGRIRVMDADVAFNWSRINNFGAREARGDVLIFLNNDTRVITPDWMERLGEKALRPDAGCVGALLLYEDGTVQHAGVTLGLGGWADHLWKGEAPTEEEGIFLCPTVCRNVTAVTGACLAVSRERFEALGGFDEGFLVCGSDVEIGIRARARGLVNIYEPAARLYHLESKSRDANAVPEQDFVRSAECYRQYRAGDPYYNPRLDPGSMTPREKEAGGARGDLGPEVAAEEMPALLTPETRAPVPVAAQSGQPRLNLLVPSVDRRHTFGGVATALRFAESLANECGWELRILVTDSEYAPETSVLGAAYETAAGSEDREARRQVTDIHDREACTVSVRRKDVFIATIWWTAHLARGLVRWQREAMGLEAPRPMIYLIQDYEPGFYPWSSRYLLAESSYRGTEPIWAVFNSGLLKAYFERDGYRFAGEWVFEPVLNERLRDFLPEGLSARKKKQILVYGRPGTARNAFELVCQGLRAFVDARPEAAEWIFLSAGEKHPDVDLGRGARLRSLGKLSLEEYARTLTETYAGISLMASPHPSYPPLEMAAFGVRTLTNRFANKDLSRFSACVESLEDCTAEGIAETLGKVCGEYRETVSWQVNPAYVRGEAGYAAAAAALGRRLAEETAEEE